VNVSQGKKGVQVTQEVLEFYNQIGIIFAGDITVECCLAKLSYLLGKRYEPAVIKRLLQESLRGEITLKESNEIFPLGSKIVVDALVNLVNIEKDSEEEEFRIATTLLPTVINEIVARNNFNLVKKLQNLIKSIDFKEFTKIMLSIFLGLCQHF
jgi:lysophospholipase